VTPDFVVAGTHGCSHEGEFAYLDVMGEPVEQSAREASGAEPLGPSGKRQRLEVPPGEKSP